MNKKKVELEDLPGVGAATAEKLREVGYGNVMSVAVASPGELVDASGVSEEVARKMIQAARDSMEMGFETADAVLARRLKVEKIKSG